MQQKQILKPWMGLLGFLGFLGFIPTHSGEPQYFTTIFFVFFGFYFWGKLGGEEKDERLIENQHKAQRILSAFFALLSFFILFLLAKERVPREVILLGGSLGYALCFILAPALVLYFDQVAN